MTSRVRVSVGFVGGKRIFGWPTGESLSQEDLRVLVPGLAHDGDMVSLAILLLASNPVMAEAGAQDRCGRPALRYDFSVPAEKSAWVLRLGSDNIVIGYHGTLWIDRSSMDPVELVMIADHLPASFEGASIIRQLNYSRATIGSNRILLPERATVVTTDADGNRTKSVVRFDECQEYRAESVIHFEPQDPDVVSSAREITRADPAVVLPERFKAELLLQSAVDSNTAAVGDPVRARLKRDIKFKGKTIVPKGTLFMGRITRMELHTGHRLLDIALLYIEIGGRRLDIATGRRNLLDLRYPGRILPGPVSAEGPRIFFPREHELVFVSTAEVASQEAPRR
ncbi:hypothetical protein [uncultured Paludibaculum sp.]|uniref:hypothetical protein n=1 Tax=uncultured Paludibaculum sp. TaxID=1765020 RepID=UPI002AAA65AA|nr:hypothetical protein [uncultured Paludibaculum sp.]